ncbi:DUF6368 family protein [Streptomyces cucumeris]|uniref:DUF6368 family protein n=1 Tax=Streptomyces cucumeris TaxID=2962890 RepID=UPI003EBBAAE2
MDVIGGVANAALREDQVPIVATLPGVIATTSDPSPAVYGSAEFLRAWLNSPASGCSNSPPGVPQGSRTDVWRLRALGQSVVVRTRLSLESLKA